MTYFAESTIEETALEWFKDLGYTIVFGDDIALGNIMVSLRDRLSQPKLVRSEVRVKDVDN